MHPTSAEPVGIAIFAKAPVEGFAKTRLAPRLGARGAAQVQRQLIEQAVRVACAANVGPVSLWCAPSVEHACFEGLSAAFPLTLHPQVGDDLGARMAHAFDVLTPGGPVLLMGTDCAVITPAHLVGCADALRHGADAVFVPVEDGGYILIGLRTPAPGLFTSMPWSTPTIMALTRERAGSAGLSIVERETLWDIDRPEDYDRAVAEGLL